MIPENVTLDELQKHFANDKFATQAAHCRIVEGSKGHAVCEMPITPTHLNAAGGVMGGAIFTLADFALAICCNIGEEPTVSVSNTVEFMSAAKGDKLIATCTCDKSGHKLGFYTTEVVDDTGRKVAKMTATCYR